MPASASESMGLRPRKAQSSSKFTAGCCAASGRDCRPPPAAAQSAAGLLAAPEVRQPGGDPPAARLLVPAPGFAVAQAALGHGVAVDHADVDLAQDLVRPLAAAAQ